MTYSDLSGFPKNIGIIDFIERKKKIYKGENSIKTLEKLKLSILIFLKIMMENTINYLDQ